MATIDDVYNLLVVVDGKIDDIKAKTDQLSFISGDVVATLDGEAVGTLGSTVLAAERYEDFPETEY